MPSNRERALDAAIDILATEGIRALTHRHVDDAAGLPEGSTSNAFRTRAALLLGIAEKMVEDELRMLAEPPIAASPEQLAESLVALFGRLTGPLRTQTSARLALLVEAAHDEAIRAILSNARSRAVQPIRSAFVAVGAADPDLAVHLVTVCFEGLFLQVIDLGVDLDPRPIITAVVRGAVASASE
ncbi:TetR family transcriptional regulator [Micropruina sp.]|uniref:TetR/AcrR family transcriptional regulator n=1 Tax=Micropruina sp. TaxID=2737536 RepID=UPI00262A7882|nr:TetR family transcriptional regulator [Micropruina sp.]